MRTQLYKALKIGGRPVLETGPLVNGLAPLVASHGTAALCYNLWSWRGQWALLMWPFPQLSSSRTTSPRVVRQEGRSDANSAIVCHGTEHGGVGPS